MGTSGSPATRAAQKKVESEPVAPVTFDHLVSRKKVRTGEVYVPTNEVIRQEVNKAAERVQMARLTMNADALTAAEAKLEQSLASLHDPQNSVRVTLKALGRDKFQELKGKHPPVEAEVAEAKELGTEIPSWNAESFMPPLVAACSVEPKMTIEQVRLLTRDEESGGYEWNDGDISALFNKAVELNLISDIGAYSF